MKEMIMEEKRMFLCNFMSKIAVITLVAWAKFRLCKVVQGSGWRKGVGM